MSSVRKPLLLSASPEEQNLLLSAKLIQWIELPIKKADQLITITFPDTNHEHANL